MKVKSIVKVMNFHSLLRVSSSKKTAEKYFEYEKHLADFTDNIMNNRNIILDKRQLKTNKNGKQLNIYIGNDMGFCGSFNSNVNEKSREDKECDKVLIGKKLRKDRQNIMLAISKAEYQENKKELEKIFYESIKGAKHSEINIIYNKYYNISKIELTKKRLLPTENTQVKDKNIYKEDFVVEGDINEILIRIMILYLLYEVKIAILNSFASENIMRQTITKESLKKIDELELEKARVIRKYKKNKSFKKSIENYIKLKGAK